MAMIRMGRLGKQEIFLTNDYNSLRNSSSLVAWLQLLRLPNVFTAVADVTMGYLVVLGELRPALYFGLLVASSVLLYLSGMVLNDVFDAKVDAQDRPDRPIPSGRISRRAASHVGRGMFIGGIAIACGLSWLAND